MDIKVKINPLHNANYYLDVNFDGINIENAKDVTLATMEEEHNHSERVAPAVHHHPEDHLEESMLGKVEDLIATGYDGNLCFERDFLGEAMDMIGRFTVPSEIMDFRENK